MDFFIINDAIISKLCILGDDVEPCFEGASVTAPTVSSNFSLDDNFKHTLYSMMQDLRNVLNGGNQQMNENVNAAENQETVVTQEQNIENYTQAENNDNVIENNGENTAAKENDPAPAENFTQENSSENNEKEQAEKYSLLEAEFNKLKEQYNELETKYQALVDFKNEIDNKNKDALISEFYMLSEEDKKDVIENKSNYTLDEIKAKLSVICFDKKISFTAKEENQEKVKTPEIMTFTEAETNNKNLPEWVKYVKEQEKNS